MRVNVYIALLCFLLSPCGNCRAETLTTSEVAQERCYEKKDVSSCYELGERYRGARSGGSTKLGDSYILFGCKLETQRPCSLEEALSRMGVYRKKHREWQEKEREYKLKNAKRSPTKDEISCEKNNIAKDCSRAAIDYYYLLNPIDPKRGEELFEKACNLGHKSSCGSLKLIRKRKIKVYDVDTGSPK